MLSSLDRWGHCLGSEHAELMFGFFIQVLLYSGPWVGLQRFPGAKASLPGQAGLAALLSNG